MACPTAPTPGKMSRSALAMSALLSTCSRSAKGEGGV